MKNLPDCNPSTRAKGGLQEIIPGCLDHLSNTASKDTQSEPKEIACLGTCSSQGAFSLRSAGNREEKTASELQLKGGKKIKPQDFLLKKL